MPQFSRLSLRNWRQFERVDLDLTAQTTVLTGANGCGKTSILSVLGHHFGWNINFISTPYISKKTRRRLYSEFRKTQRPTHSAKIPEDFDEDVPPDQAPLEVGEIEYANGSLCKLNSPSQVSMNAHYQLQYTAMQGVIGLLIPSHRPAAVYHQVSQIPTDPRTSTQHYQEFQQLLLQSMSSGGNVRNPGGILKQSLIALAVFGYGNDAVAENTEYIKLFEAFQNVLRAILPEKLGFQKLEIRMPDIVLITDSGQFSLDAMSGGINALFTIAWQIQMFAWGKDSCTVLIDEPENHLHPSMQRSLLPSLATAFPKYKFIVATHSPFVVTSNPRANVFALTHNVNRRIESEHLDAADLAASPEKVLRDILEVPTSIPIWVEDRIKQALAQYQDQAADPQALDALFTTLKTLGMSDSIAKLADGVG